MYPSSALCRSQEAFHHARADAAQLDNVRAVSSKAAKAWGIEAAAAEAREARSESVRIGVLAKARPVIDPDSQPFDDWASDTSLPPLLA